MGFFILIGIAVAILIISIYLGNKSSKERSESFIIINAGLFAFSLVTVIIGSIMCGVYCDTGYEYRVFKKQYERAVIMSKASDIPFEQKVTAAIEINKVNERILDEVNFCQKSDFWYGLYKNYDIAALEYIEYDFE